MRAVFETVVSQESGCLGKSKAICTSSSLHRVNAPFLPMLGLGGHRMPISHHFPWGPFDLLVPNATFFRLFTRIEQYCNEKRSQGVWISFLPLSFVFSGSPFKEARCKLPPALPKLLNFWDAISSPERVRNQIVHGQKSPNRQRGSFSVWWEEEICKM